MRPDLIVTNAHVVAGADDTTVTTQSGVELDATAVYYQPEDDLALLRVDSRLPTLPITSDRAGRGGSAAVLGYPENGPYTVTPARIGETRDTLSEDSYGRGPIERTITALGGDVRSGNSGGPLLDSGGEVVGHRLRGDDQRAGRRLRGAGRGSPRSDPTTPRPARSSTGSLHAAACKIRTDSAGP